jgi:hypothetical protein
VSLVEIDVTSEGPLGSSRSSKLRGGAEFKKSKL